MVYVESMYHFHSEISLLILDVVLQDVLKHGWEAVIAAAASRSLQPGHNVRKNTGHYELAWIETGLASVGHNVRKCTSSNFTLTEVSFLHGTYSHGLE